MAFSSNQNALSSREIGLAARPDGPGSTALADIGTDKGVAPLFGIGESNRERLGVITFAGGVPIYSGASLVGAIGVSGDGVDEDEQVAICGVQNAAGTTGLTTPFSPACLSVAGGHATRRGLRMSEPAPPSGHPTSGVFMKCWRCQAVQRLADDGRGGLRCPHCQEILISLDDQSSGEQ